MKYKYSLLIWPLLLVSCDVGANIDNSTSESASTPNVLDAYTYNENMLNTHTLEMQNNDTSVLDKAFDDLGESTIEIYIPTKGIISYSYNYETELYYLESKGVGDVDLYIIKDGEEYDKLHVTVSDDTSKFSTNVMNLYGKTFTVFGDSISDVTNTAYPTNRPDFWCEQLRDDYNMTMYNFALSGTTACNSVGLVNVMGQSWTNLNCGTGKVCEKQAKEAIEVSDYVFIYYGNNDVSYGAEIGELDDITETNKNTKESFKGSYCYIIDKIREYNPDVKIVCLSLSTSTWSITKYNSNNYAKSREEMCTYVEEVANYKKAKYINIYGLWTTSNYQEYCTDGIHPITAGYNLIVKKILEG